MNYIIKHTDRKRHQTVWRNRVGEWFFLALIWLLLCCSTPDLFAQQKLIIDYEYLLEEMATAVEKGDKIALRDLGNLLSKPAINAKVVSLLQRYTLFTERELIINAELKPAAFLDFYYQNANALKFHQLLKAFYLTPPAERSVPYTIELLEREEMFDPVNRLRQHIQTLRQNIADDDFESVRTQIDRIGQLDIPEGYQYLIGLLERTAFGKKKEAEQLYVAICEEIVRFHDFSTLTVLLKAYKSRTLKNDAVKNYLAQLTNIEVKDKNPIPAYQWLRDSCVTMDAMRQLGYDRKLSYRIDYFEHPVDYYGKAFLQADSIAWLARGAMDDMLSTHHPRALYYLALKLYSAVLEDVDEARCDYWFAILQKVVAARVEVYDGSKAFTSQPDWRNDKKGSLNYFLFWASHYDDFEWDETRLQYINKTVSRTLSNKYKFLIRRLTSPNDSLAQRIYVELTEGNPRNIIPLMDRYRPVLSRHNKSLPPINYYYLESLTELTTFCKQNNQIYKPEGKIAEQLQVLMQPLSPKKRIQLENEMIAQLGINDLTSLEYFALLHTVNTALSTSVSRILDQCYAKYWNQIWTDDLKLRFYLKKTFLFGKIGTVGSCSTYEDRIQLEKSKIQNRLKALRQLEIDAQIKLQIEYLLSKSGKQKLYNWTDLMQSNIELTLIPKPSPKSYAAIFDSIQVLKDEAIQLRLLLYLSLHPDIEQTPHLIELIQKDIVKNESTRLLETIYAYKFRSRGTFASEAWTQLWANDSTDYQTWGNQFLDQAIDYLSSAERLSVNDINAVFSSPYYDPKKHRAVCLQALRKLQPIRYIDRLQLRSPISVDREFEVIENLELSVRDLPKLLNLITVDAPEKFLKYLRTKTSKVKLQDAAKLYSELVDQSWFKAYLTEGNTNSALISQIERILEKYTSQLSPLSKQYERNEIAKHFLAFANEESVMKKLESTSGLKIDDRAKADYQRSIIQALTYEQLADAIRYYRKLSPAFDYNFLLNDFGLPIFDLSDSAVRSDLIARQGIDSKAEVYSHYLTKFGVKFDADKQQLDYKKIYDILRFDAPQPFSGSDTIRDYYVFGIIKLLEMNLNTTLNFPPKKVDDKDLQARIQAWMTYLIQQKLVKPPVVVDGT